MNKSTKPTTTDASSRLSSAGREFLATVNRTTAHAALTSLKVEIASHNWLDRFDKLFLGDLVTQKLKKTPELVKTSTPATGVSKGYRGSSRRGFQSVY